MNIFELPSHGLMPPRGIGSFNSMYRDDAEYAWTGGPYSTEFGYYGLDAVSLIWQKLNWLDARQYQMAFWGESNEDDLRYFSVPLAEAFRLACRAYNAVTINPEVMAGAPCIQGTRIPVYMILDALEYYGSFQGVLDAYPRLTLDQVKDAVGFTKLVVECPIEHEDSPATR
jgi:uncharacterized protein (DUF433 family)